MDYNKCIICIPQGQLTVSDAIHGATGGGQSGVRVLVLRVLTTCEKPSEVRCE